MNVKLAAPGAGISLIERIIGKLSITYSLYKNTPEKMLKIFIQESSKICELIDLTSENQLHQKVLIKRIPGIEDSSRHWSISMVIEHLILTMDGMSLIINALQQSNQLNLKVNTADVKPQGKLDNLSGPELKSKFEFEYHQTVKRVNENIRIKQSDLTHKHPWFGEMQSQQWISLLAMHQSIHRKQIQSIKQGLTINQILTDH